MIEENKSFWGNCGHTYEEHVDVDNQDLKNRVMFGTYESGRFDGQGKSICSRFSSEKIAKIAIERAIEIRCSEIEEWMKLGYQEEIIVTVNFSKAIGVGYAKGTNLRKDPYLMYSICVVLRADAHFRSYSIVTAYPTPNRNVGKQIAKDKKDFYEERRARRTQRQ